MKKTTTNNKTVENRMKGRFARFNKEAKWKYPHKDFEYKKLAEYIEETGLFKLNGSPSTVPVKVKPFLSCTNFASPTFKKPTFVE